MATVQCLTAVDVQSYLEDLRINFLTLPTYLPIANEIYNLKTLPKGTAGSLGRC